MDWKKSFQADVREKLRFARKEHKQYLSTGRIIHLQQAGNKLFSAVENYLMFKYDKRVVSYRDLKAIVTDTRDKKLLLDAAQLHYFYYNGGLHMPYYDAEDFFVSVNKRIQSRVN